MEEKRQIRFFQVVQFATYCATGLWAYYIIYLRNLGFDSREIGLISAVGTAASLVALPIMGVVSDKIRSPRKMLALCLLLAEPLFFIVPFLGKAVGPSVGVFAVLTALMIVFRRPINTMMDSWTGAAMDRLGVNYGMIRLFGSIGFTAASVPASFLIGSLLPDWSGCVLMTLMTVPVLFLILGKRASGYEAPPEVKKKPQVSTKELLRCVFCNAYFLSYLLLILAISLFLAVTEVYYTYIMDGAGVPTTYIGVVSGVRAMWEVAIMVLVGKSRRRPPAFVLLSLSGLLIGAEHLFYHGGSGLAFLLLVVFFTGIGGGLYYGTGNSYLFRIVDPKAATTALSVVGFLMAGINIAVSMAGGAVIETYGITVVTDALAVAVLVLTALFAGVTAFFRYGKKLPYASEIITLSDGTKQIVSGSI